MTHKPSAPAAVAPATSPSAGRAVPTAEATQAPPQAAGEASAAYEALIRADEREAILRLLPGGQTCDPQEIADMIRARGDAASCLLAEVKRLQGEVQHWREARHTAMLAGELLKEDVDRLRARLDQIAAHRAGGGLD